jgi:hypothetical protein
MANEKGANMPRIPTVTGVKATSPSMSDKIGETALTAARMLAATTMIPTKAKTRPAQIRCGRSGIMGNDT